jgi:hypothetical protein
MKIENKIRKLSFIRRVGKNLVLPSIGLFIIGYIIDIDWLNSLGFWSLLISLIIWKGRFSYYPCYSSSVNHSGSSIMNTQATKPIGHDWSSATGSNLINSPTFSSFNGNIYNRH